MFYLESMINPISIITEKLQLWQRLIYQKWLIFWKIPELIAGMYSDI